MEPVTMQADRMAANNFFMIEILLWLYAGRVFEPDFAWLLHTYLIRFRLPDPQNPRSVYGFLPSFPRGRMCSESLSRYGFICRKCEM